MSDRMKDIAAESLARWIVNSFTDCRNICRGIDDCQKNDRNSWIVGQKPRNDRNQSTDKDDHIRLVISLLPFPRESMAMNIVRSPVIPVVQEPAPPPLLH